MGSSIYHRNREAIYFNLDNIFATSLLVSYCWSLCIAYGAYEAYFIFGLVGIPVAIFLLVYCGMPADITIIKNASPGPLCCTRSDRPLYNSVHALWHVASGCGPLLSVWMFSNYAADHGNMQILSGIKPETMVMGSAVCFDSWGWMPVVPTTALLLGVLLNLTGNYFGVMPMN